MKKSSCLMQIKNNLDSMADRGKSLDLARFFKTSEGEYGEGDIFIGVSVPEQRRIAKLYHKEIDLDETVKLLKEPVHEYRLTALFIMVLKFEKALQEEEKSSIASAYLENLEYVNNWDLVDSSAYKILGPYLFARERSVLYTLASSGNLWKQRTAIISTLYFIKQFQFDDTLKLAEILINHNHDLIHKASGWMIREISNRDYNTGLKFLKKHYLNMPRTMLRYAIEKYDEDIRQKFLKSRW